MVSSLPKKTGNPKAATAVAEDLATEFDEPIVPQRNGNAKTTHDVSKQSLKASAVPSEKLVHSDKAFQTLI